MSSLLRVFLEKYIEYMKIEKDLNENTLKSYLGDIENFSLYLEEKSIVNIENINKTVVIQYLVSLEKLEKAPSTIARNLSSIKSYYEFLINKRYVINNPTIGLKAPKVERKISEVLTHDEVDILLMLPDEDSFKGSRDKAMLELMYSTGIGVNEIVGLNIGDLDLEMDTLVVGTNSNSRIVPVGTLAIDALSSYIEKLEDKSPDKPLFINSRKDRLTRQGFWKNLKEYEKKSGIEKNITPQMLRQSFAVHMIENGADLEVVQKMLGHSDLTTTQIYLYKSTNGNVREVHKKYHPRG